MTPRNSLSILLLLIALMHCHVGAQEEARLDPAEKTAVDRVKKVPVQKLDAQLPKRPLVQWLQEVVGPAAKIRWEVNDCGEQTGSPMDRDRDIPLCVGVYAKLEDQRKVQILINVGSSRKGLVQTPQIYDIAVDSGATWEHVAKLHDLTALVKGSK